jgi:hypothetical protein
MRLSPSMIVALLALFVALGGTGYAVTALPKNSVGAKQLKRNAVTGKKIRKSSVTSSKVKNFSLLSRDFKHGELPAGAQGPKGDPGPPGPTFAAAATNDRVGGASGLSSTPDETSDQATTHGRHFEFSLPTGGTIYVRLFVPIWGTACTAGLAQFGLYLDGAPVAGTAQTLPLTGAPVEAVKLMSAAAGAHSLEARYDCPDGTLNNASYRDIPTWTVLLVGG